MDMRCARCGDLCQWPGDFPDRVYAICGWCYRDWATTWITGVKGSILAGLTALWNAVFR